MRAGCCQEPSEVTSGAIRSGHPALRGDSVVHRLSAGQPTGGCAEGRCSEGSKLIDSLCSDRGAQRRGQSWEQKGGQGRLV